MNKPGIIIRSIFRNKLNSGIIIISLSVGIACFNLILLFIGHELKTDAFHADADRIFALKCDDPWIPGRVMYHCRFGSAEFMKKNFALVEDYCRINNANSQKINVNNREYFDQTKIIAATRNFFDFFSYGLLTGNPGTVLEASDNIVISRDLANKYFGTSDAVGQIIKVVSRGKEEEMIVTGIFEKPSENTQILFDMVRLIGETDSRCYIKLNPGADSKVVEKLMEENKTTIPIINTGNPGSYYLEPMRSAYFDTTRGLTIEASRNRRDLWIALVIGCMIIGVAAFNYLGLLNNRFFQKAQEYSVRRINGASKFSLLLDFLAENGFMLFTSFLLSLYLMEEMLPFFNELTGIRITTGYIFEAGNFIVLLTAVLLLLLLTLVFGLLRNQSPISSGTLIPDNQNVKRIQIPASNIFQLASSVALIICTTVIIKQMNFISKKPIGLDKSNIEVRIPAQYSEKVSVFKEELLKNSSISKVSVVGASPLLEHFLLLLEYEQDGVKKQYSPAGFSGDENYLDVLGIELIEGDGFPSKPSPNSKICLINQTFAKLFSDRDLIGKKVPGMDDQIITGIVRDFHYTGLTAQIEPAFISYSDAGSHLMVKSAGNLSETREAITRIWTGLIPDYPVNIESTGDRFEWYHRANNNYLRLIASCSLISLFLAMIGLFAVSYQNSRQRTKEIGIRKINGAGIIDILQLLNRDFVIWVMIAFVIASPVAWFAMNKWLQNYAYQTEFSWWIFPLAGSIALVIAILTVTLQSLRTATRNPVEALRYE